MNHFIKIFLFSLVVFSFSCKKDDVVAADTIVGTWNLTAATCNDGVSTTTVDSEVLTSTFTSLGKNFATTVTFKADGTYTSGGTYTAVLVSTTDGQSFTSEVDVPAFAGAGTWSIASNKLTVNDGTTTQIADIVENTASKFSYKAVVNKTTTTTDYSSVTKATYNFTLTK
jgi:Domain of unknown function (DUF5004)